MFDRLRRRQREEFEYQALPHLNALFRTAMQMRGSPEAAEDAVQETYLQAWKYWKTFQLGTNCRAWLFRILFNVLKKKHDKHSAAESPLEEMPVDNVVAFEPNRKLETYEVMQVFAMLEEEHRAVLVLIAVEEMSYKEAASVLGVPVGTVMSRLSRARRALRRLLGLAKTKASSGGT